MLGLKLWLIPIL